jgi:hypothetical protein
MKTYIPVSTIAEGMGLNVTVHSYLDELEFGLIACRELVPDLWHMVDLHLAEIDVLFAAAGVSRNGDAPVQAVIDAASESRQSAQRSATGNAANERASNGGTTATTSAARTTTAKRATADERRRSDRWGRQSTVTKRGATKDGAATTGDPPGAVHGDDRAASGHQDVAREASGREDPCDEDIGDEEVGDEDIGDETSATKKSATRDSGERDSGHEDRSATSAGREDSGEAFDREEADGNDDDGREDDREHVDGEEAGDRAQGRREEDRGRRGPRLRLSAARPVLAASLLASSA